MPSPASVHAQLTDILVRVVDCPAEAVVRHDGTTVPSSTVPPSTVPPSTVKTRSSL